MWKRRLVVLLYSQSNALQIRRLLRGYFLNPLCKKTSTQLENSEAALWLSSILRNLEKPESQAQLLVVLFGPASKGNFQFKYLIISVLGQVDWTSSVDNVVTSEKEAESRFYPLANAISELLKLRELKQSLCHWKDSEIFNLIEEITSKFQSEIVNIHQSSYAQSMVL